MFYLDYILYTTIIVLLCILIYKKSNYKENFEHRGGAKMAVKPPAAKKNPPPGFFDIIYNIINVIYQFLLIFSRILTTPFKFLNGIGDSFNSSYNDVTKIFTKIYDLFVKIGIFIKGKMGDLSNSYGADNYDLTAFFKDPIGTIEVLIS